MNEFSVYKTLEPYSAEHHVHRVSCFHCRQQYREAMRMTPGGGLQLCSWGVTEEVLQKQVDYSRVFRQDRLQFAMGPTQSMSILWAWRPIPIDDEQVAGIQRALTGEMGLQMRKQYRLLICPPGGSKQLSSLWPLFHEVFEVHQNVLLGADGPFPSIKAELSLQRTWGAMGLDRVIHIWPAVKLSCRDYMATMDSEQMQSLWSRSQRVDIPIKIA